MSHRLPSIRVPVSLRRLFPHGSFVGCADVRVVDATERSFDCGPGMLFAAIPGTRVEGDRFTAEAIQRGASSVLVQRPLPGVSVPQCVVPCVRKAFAELCSALAGNPSHKLHISGVTGTNGKTTVTWLIRSILRAAGRQAGLLGTVEYHDGLSSQPAALTTPDSKTLSTLLCRMQRIGTTHAAIELSSHALDQDRTSGTQLDAAIVTNITQDHFDYHENFSAYLESKARIFRHCKREALALLNLDDPGSSSLYDELPSGVKPLRFGFAKGADVTAEFIRETQHGSRFVLKLGQGSIEVQTHLAGRHNIANCLAAAAAAEHGGASLDAIAFGIESLRVVPGRLERIECGQPFAVYVDYAHTPDALGRAIGSLRQLTRGRVICVFGAGGDRDRMKRPQMGQAAAEADLVIVTSDNPRGEDPERIIEDILAGIDPGSIEPHVEPDRAEAIRWALEQAEPGDSVLVAGKGHETVQIIGSRHFPFDDRQVVRQTLTSHWRLPAQEPLRLRA